MEKEEVKKLVNKLIRQTKSQYPNDATMGQRAVLSMLADECATLIHHLKRDSFPPGRNKDLRDLEKLQKELEKVVSVCVLIQGGKLNLPPNLVEELKQKLKEMGILAERDHLEEKAEEQRWLQERDNLTKEQLAEQNNAIEKQIIKFRKELEGFFREIYKTEQDRMKVREEYLKSIEAGIICLSIKIEGLEKEVQEIRNIIEDKEKLVEVDKGITDIEDQIVDDHTNLAMKTLQEGGVKETSVLREDVRQKTANIVRSNREEIASGTITSKQIVSTVVKEAPISAKEKVAVLAVIENPSALLQKQFDDVKAKSGTLFKDLQKLSGEKKGLETQLKEHLKAHPEIKEDATLTERVNELVKQINKCKDEKAQLEKQAEKIKQEIKARVDNKPNGDGSSPNGPLSNT